MSEKNNSGVTPTELIEGVKRVEVILRTGARETVFVRCLSPRLVKQWLALADDEPAIVELMAGKPAGWSDTIDEDSFYHVLEVGEEVNKGPLARYISKRQARAERFAGIVRAVNPLTGGSPASASAPA